MFRCILQSTDNKYYSAEGFVTDPQEALCFENRYDADYEKDSNPMFKDGKVIPVILQDDGTIKLYPTQYLVISYKPSHQDYCRGCLMATYESKLEKEVFQSEEEVIEHCAKLNASLDGMDTDFEHWIVTQDELFGGMNYLDCSYGHIPSEMLEKIKARTEQLKSKK